MASGNNVRQHVILLPAEDYWEWVEAVRDYAVTYRISVTPSPQNAVDFHPPDQVITVVDAGGSYPGHDDIASWLSEQEPAAEIDLLAVSDPDELREILAERIERRSPFPQPELRVEPAPDDFKLRWPTESRTVMQWFGANPELYRRWGLPGHEGVDFEADFNSPVYACADGEVYMVHDGTMGHAYGIHVRIRHASGFKTIYAHLNQALVHSGTVVKAGDLIGLADSTGNSATSHLHLTLKREGATAAGLTAFPGDIVNPWPYLEKEEPGEATAEWLPTQCLVGVNGRVGGAMTDADWDVLQQAKVEAVLLQADTATAEDVTRMQSISRDAYVVVGLPLSNASRPISARSFARTAVQRLRALYDAGVRDVELGYEPNVVAGGLGVNWMSGAEFATWFQEAVNWLRQDLPEIRVGFPGLSPGATAGGLRAESVAFLEEAAPAMEAADWIGVHCFWADEGGAFSPEGGYAYRAYRNHWPDKPLLITEFSNTSPHVPMEDKAQEYAEYYAFLRRQPGLAAAFSFAVSAATGYEHEAWRAEDGAVSAIPEVIGAWAEGKA